MRDFAISPTQMGAIYSAFILGYAILMIPGGYLSDRPGARLTLALMGIFSAIFTGLIVLAGKPGLGAFLGIVPALFAVRLGLGVLTARLYPACARMIANWIPVVCHACIQGWCGVYLFLAFGLAAFCEGPLLACVTEIAGERVGAASSILNTGAQVGGFFAPLALSARLIYSITH